MLGTVKIALLQCEPIFDEWYRVKFIPTNPFYGSVTFGITRIMDYPSCREYFKYFTEEGVEIKGWKMRKLKKFLKEAYDSRKKAIENKDKEDAQSTIAANIADSPILDDNYHEYTTKLPIY